MNMYEIEDISTYMIGSYFKGIIIQKSQENS